MQNTWNLSSFGRVVLVSIDVEGQAGRPSGRKWKCAVQVVEMCVRDMEVQGNGKSGQSMQGG